MMTAKEVTDNGMSLLRLASREFYFTAEYAGLFLQMCKDSASRVDVMTVIFPRIVDAVNVQHSKFKATSNQRSHLHPESRFCF